MINITHKFTLNCANAIRLHSCLAVEILQYIVGAFGYLILAGELLDASL